MTTFQSLTIVFSAMTFVVVLIHSIVTIVVHIIRKR